MIAQMESDYQASRLLWLRSGWLKNQGRRNTRETGLAKWFATVASERAAGDAVQVHGANGYSDEYPVGRFYRNCKGAVIYEGTREIHKLMQADYVLGYRQDRPTRCELPPFAGSAVAAIEPQVTSVWRRTSSRSPPPCFIGFTGFTLVMPFLPLYFQQLGVHDVGEIALWSGLSLGVTPALTALLSPFWGRLADRYGRKIMVERSLFSFIFLMAAMAFVDAAVARLRAAGGAGAVRRLRRADAHDGGRLRAAGPRWPRDRHRADRAAAGPGDRADHRRRRRAAGRAAACASWSRRRSTWSRWCSCSSCTTSGGVAPSCRRTAAGRLTFRNVLAFENFILLMAVIFALQFVDRSFGPVLPLYRRPSWAPRPTGCRWSPGCCSRSPPRAGAVGHHVCGIAAAARLGAGR